MKTVCFRFIIFLKQYHKLTLLGQFVENLLLKTAHNLTVFLAAHELNVNVTTCRVGSKQHHNILECPRQMESKK